jgi:hypothetical protein
VHLERVREQALCLAIILGRDCATAGEHPVNEWRPADTLRRKPP